MKHIGKLFHNFYRHHGKLVLLYIALTIVHKILAFVSPLTSQWLIDAVVALDTRGFLTALIATIVTTVLFVVVLYLRSYWGETAENHALSLERKHILGDMLRVSFPSLRGKPVGHYLHFMERDADMVKGLAFYDITVQVSNICLTIAMLVYLFRCDWLLTLVVLCVLPLFVLFSRVMLPRMEKATREVNHREEDLNDLVEEFYAGNETIRAANAQAFFQNRAEDKTEAWRKARQRYTRLDNTYDIFLVTGLMNVANTAIYCLGGWRAMQGILTIGTITTFTLYFSSLWNTMEGFMIFLKEYRMKKVSMDRLLSLHDAVPPENPAAEPVPSFESLRVEGISFSYGDKTVLHNFSMEISKGERVRISGENGSGKSTLARILVGLLPISGGKITYNGRDYAGLDVGSLRQHVVLVPSDAFLIGGSLEENFWGRTPTGPVPSFLSGRNFKAGGANLSSGQKKQLQLCRCLGAEGDVYILDEPFNFVDQEAKAQLWALILQVFQDKTLLVISHDPFPEGGWDKVIQIG